MNVVDLRKYYSEILTIKHSSEYNRKIVEAYLQGLEMYGLLKTFLEDLNLETDNTFVLDLIGKIFGVSREIPIKILDDVFMGFSSLDNAFDNFGFTSLDTPSVGLPMMGLGDLFNAKKNVINNRDYRDLLKLHFFNLGWDGTHAHFDEYSERFFRGGLFMSSNKDMSISIWSSYGFSKTIKDLITKFPNEYLPTGNGVGVSFLDIEKLSGSKGDFSFIGLDFNDDSLGGFTQLDNLSIGGKMNTLD